MTAQGCELLGEIRYGRDLSFEQVAELEARLRDRTQELLADMAPAWAEFSTTGDDLRFIASLPDYDPEALLRFCGELRGLLDPEGRGRLVAVATGFGPVRSWVFWPGGVNVAQLLCE